MLAEHVAAVDDLDVAQGQLALELGFVQRVVGVVVLEHAAVEVGREEARLPDLHQSTAELGKRTSNRGGHI